MKEREYEEMSESIYEVISKYQMIEALEQAANILESWTDLLPLAEPIRKAQQDLSESAAA